MIDAVVYKNGAKNQWRRTAWNAIADGVQDRANALVLYLPGSTDLDRPEAMRRGFKPANLIAVERQPEVCELLRAEGATTICGSLTEVLEAWPVHVPVRCVVADFQCGMTDDVRRFEQLCCLHPALAQCTVLVNLQRGRDPMHCQLRDVFMPTRAQLNAFGWSADDVELAMRYLSGNRLSRAEVFAKLVRPQIEEETRLARKPALDRANADFDAALEQGKAALQRGDLSAAREHERLASDALSRSDELRTCYEVSVRHLPAYRSTDRAPYMDSCVMTWHGDHEYRAAKWTRRRAEFSGAVAAALAIRTRRLRGELGGGKRA